MVRWEVMPRNARAPSATARRRGTRLLTSAIGLALIAGPACGSGANAPPSAQPGSSLPPAPSPGSTSGTTTSTAAGARPSAGCATRPGGTRVPDRSTGTIEVDGTSRTYLLSIPTDASSSRPAPVVVLLHGMGSSAEDINRVSSLPDNAARANTIVVTADATGTPAMWRPAAQGPDAAFLDALLTKIEQTSCVDTARITVVGFSVGAAFAAAYACARQDRIASLVTVTVEFPADCQQPMPILSFHGTADPVVPYSRPDPNSPGGAAGTEANMRTWAQKSRCDAEPEVTEIGSEVTKLAWTGCADGSEVTLYKIIGGGHDWPGKDPATAVMPSTQQIIATDEALAFAARHRLGT